MFQSDRHRRMVRPSRRRLFRQSDVVAIMVAWLAFVAWWLVLPSGRAEGAGGGPSVQSEANHKPPRLKSKTLLATSPEPGAVVRAQTWYTREKGLEKMCVMYFQRRSDVFDNWQRRFSPDNGKTWSAWEPIDVVKVQTPQGMHRQNQKPCWIDPVNGRMLMMVLDGVLPNDDPMEGMTRWSLRYRVSTDGGRSFAVDDPVIQKGDYTAEHPIDGVWVGKNSMMIGATSCRPIRTKAGRVLVPVQITPLGPDGHYWNPGGGYTYHDAAVLIGKWTDSMKIEWDLSQRVVGDPRKSTRGCLEPTLAEMPDGRILMVCRGSNDVKLELPGYKWYSVSDDGGRHWSNPPKPWTYADGSAFFSSSSCSQLLRHSNGKYYWLGNISPHNPRGNNPRYPLVIGQLDPESLLLLKETVAVIDTRGAGDNSSLLLSNFIAHEDRVGGDIVLDMTRRLDMPRSIISAPPPWRGDAYTYRIEP